MPVWRRPRFPEPAGEGYALAQMTPQYLHNRAGLEAAALEPYGGLQIAVIHEDALPLKWASQVTRRAIQLLGSRLVRTARWSVETLGDPIAMGAAIEAAVTADILVVVVSGDRALPPNVDRWIDAWLPRRLDRAGALVALIGTPRQPNAFSTRIREYLRDVASLAHLDLLTQEPSLPCAHSVLLRVQRCPKRPRLPCPFNRPTDYTHPGSAPQRSRTATPREPSRHPPG